MFWRRLDIAATAIEFYFYLSFEKKVGGEREDHFATIDLNDREKARWLAESSTLSKQEKMHTVAIFFWRRQVCLIGDLREILLLRLLRL